MTVLTRSAGRAQPPHRGLFYVALVIAAVASLALAFLFVWPRLDTGKTRFDLGSTDDYAIGRVYTRNDGKFHLVRLSDTDVIALSWRSPDRGCTVPWRPTFEFAGETGWFRDPCGGSTFRIDGTRVFGPAPGDMFRFPVSTVGGRIVVRTDAYLCGHASPGERCIERAAP